MRTGAIYGVDPSDRGSPRAGLKTNSHSVLLAQKRGSVKDGAGSSGMNATGRSTQPSWHTQMRGPKSREGSTT